MSALPITANSAPPQDAAAALERIAQLQQLIAQTAAGFSSVSSSGGTAAPASDAAASSSDFSSLLASASSATTTSSAADGSTSSLDGGYGSIIDAAASQYGISPALLTGLIHQESDFDPNAVSSAGAEGLTQVMPENFAADGITNPFDPTQSIYGGAKQLSEDLSEFGGNVTDALAAYNAGSAAVREYGGVPPYTQTENYVTSVLNYAQQYSEQAGQSPTATDTGEPVNGEGTA
jgi:soluble lytic murein transglycosylase-like protein